MLLSFFMDGELAFSKALGASVWQFALVQAIHRVSGGVRGRHPDRRSSLDGSDVDGIGRCHRWPGMRSRG